MWWLRPFVCLLRRSQPLQLRPPLQVHHLARELSGIPILRRWRYPDSLTHRRRPWLASPFRDVFYSELHAAVCSDRATKALLKTENKRTSPGRSRGTVLAPEMPRRMPGFGYALVAKRGDR